MNFDAYLWAFVQVNNKLLGLSILYFRRVDGHHDGFVKFRELLLFYIFFNPMLFWGICHHKFNHGSGVY
jgi:hypothetical protein